LYDRDAVAKGPDPFADYDFCSYVCLSDKEALSAAVTALQNVVEDGASYDPYLEYPE
jgi:hypothetical protein